MIPVFSMDDGSNEYAKLETAVTKLEHQAAELQERVAQHETLLNRIAQQLDNCDAKLELIEELLSQLDAINSAIAPNSNRHHAAQTVLPLVPPAAPCELTDAAQYEANYLNALQQ